VAQSKIAILPRAVSIAGLLLIAGCGGGDSGSSDGRNGGTGGTGGNGGNGGNTGSVDATVSILVDGVTQNGPMELSQYLEKAREHWDAVGTSGLAGVLQAIADVGYDHEAVKNWLLQHDEYRAVNPHRETAPNRAHPFALANIHVAQAAGLTGAGQLIAVNDVNFHADHPDLQASGRAITCFTPVSAEADDPVKAADVDKCIAYGDGHHGTSVAVIAAGALNDSGVMGVAPEADLLLLDHVGEDGSESFGISGGRLQAQVEKAKELGAVVLNNSWSIAYLDTATEDQIKFSNAWYAWLYDGFQDSGVVVFAKPNKSSDLPVDDPLYSPTSQEMAYFADLPHDHPELREAWISAVNAQFQVDPSTGDVTEVNRQSYACALSAAWCLVGSGDMVVADDQNGFTDQFTGTSFVAPQISGGVALLALAFPSLGPADLTARLLASANNGWFLLGSQVVDVDGALIYDQNLIEDSSGNPLERCWNENTANPVCHEYSLEWGHGIMDIEAALSPIGGLSLLGGTSVTTAQRHSLEQSSLSAPSGRTQSLRDALGFSLTVFDGLNTNFDMPASDLVTPVISRNTIQRLLDRYLERDTAEQLAFSTGALSFTASTAATSAGLPASFQAQSGSFGEGIVTRFGFSSEDVATTFGGISSGSGNGIGGGNGFNAIGFTGLMGDMSYAALASGQDSMNNFMVYGFAGENRNTENAMISGLGARYAFSLAETAVEMSGSYALEEGSSLGISGDDALWFGGNNALVSGQLALQRNFGDGYRISGRVELGSAEVDSGGALVHSAEQAYYTGFDVQLEKHGLWQSDDQLALWVSQPLRLEQGRMVLNVPTGRTREGVIEYRDEAVDLAPQGRQIDVGLNYKFANPQSGASARFGVVHSFNTDHQQGQQDTAVAASYRFRF